MRSFFWTILLLLLASCTAGSPAIPSAARLQAPAATVQRPAGLPGLPELEDPLRSGSAGEDLEHGIVALGPGAEADLVGDALFGVDLEVLPGEQVSWAIQRSGPWKDSPLLDWVSASNDTGDDVGGACYVAVADWAAMRWRFFDVSEPGIPGSQGPGEWWLGCFLDGVADPISPDGYLYFVTLSYGEGSEARANNGPSLLYEYDEPYLEPPLITELERLGDGARFKYDPGPDADLMNSFKQELYVCQGEVFIEEQSTKVSSGNLGGGWRSAGGPYEVSESWTYSMRLELGFGIPGVIEPGKWSDPYTLPPAVEE